MSLLTSLRHLFTLLLLAVLTWSLMLGQNVLLTSAVVICSGLGWWLGRWVRVQGHLCCQIARAALMALALAGSVALQSHPPLELALLAYCGFAAGLMIALTSPRGGGRRSWRARFRRLQGSFTLRMSRRPLSGPVGSASGRS